MEFSVAHNSEPADHCPRALLGLAVFQDVRKAEYIRSIHLYDRGGTAFTIQQEFLLKPGAFSQISQPIPVACFCSLSPTDLKQCMAMLKKMHENEWCKCVLEFCSDSPGDTFIMPLLSASRNPELQSIPSLARDLRLVETAIEGKTVFSTSDYSPRSSLSVVAETNDGCRDAVLHDNQQTNWNHANWTLPALYSLPSAESTEQMAVESPNRAPQSLQLDLWHEWGSDLELASPRISETFDLGILRNSVGSDPSMPLYTATMSASSPTSSSFSSQNADSSSWGDPSLLADASHAILDFPLDDSQMPINMLSSQLSPNGSDVFVTTGMSVSLPNSVMANQSQIVCFPFERPGSSNMLVKKESEGFPLESPRFDTLLKLEEMKRTRSMCSNTGAIGAGERAGKAVEGLPQICLPSDTTDPSLSPAACGNDVFFLENSDSPATSSDLRWGGRARRRNTNDRQPADSRQNHHRGSSERLTEITLNELSQYFNMPITQASKELKVGLTVLKKRCREFGIPRWPHRKMKSLDSLIHNIQDLAKDDGAKESNRVLNAVKELEEQKKAMGEKPGTELAERTKRLRQACFKASYKKRRQQQAQISISSSAQEEGEEEAACIISLSVPSHLCTPSLIRR